MEIRRVSDQEFAVDRQWRLGQAVQMDFDDVAVVAGEDTGDGQWG